MKQHRIYLDHAATTPAHPEVLAAMQPYFNEVFGNPHSFHGMGREAGQAVARARSQVAGLLGAAPAEIIFTSGGTEADNLAIIGVALARQSKGKHIITSTVEHHAVLNACIWLEAQGFEVSYLGVDAQGRIDPENIRAAIREDTILISIMHANNETGVLAPLEDIGRIAREHGIVFHTDAVQSAGLAPIDLSRLPVDLLSLSSHKLYGPKGVGALYVRQGLRLVPIFHGGGHEQGVRSGTLNVPGIVGLGQACELAAQDMSVRQSRLRELRDNLERAVLAQCPEVRINGLRAERLPGISSLAFEGLEAESIVAGLDARGVIASAGAACRAHTVEASHVLSAMGLPHELAFATVRLSLGRENTAAELTQAARVLTETVAALRNFYAEDAHDVAVFVFEADTGALPAWQALQSKGLRSVLAAVPPHLRQADISPIAAFCGYTEEETARKILDEARVGYQRVEHLHGISKPLKNKGMASLEKSFWDELE